MAEWRAEISSPRGGEEGKSSTVMGIRKGNSAHLQTELQRRAKTRAVTEAINDWQGCRRNLRSSNASKTTL
jgi:hypothetical protein